MRKDDRLNGRELASLDTFLNSHPEIAEILNQPIGTVKSHVHRAVRILRRILGPQVGRLAPSGDAAHAVL